MNSASHPLLLAKLVALLGSIAANGLEPNYYPDVHFDWGAYYEQLGYFDASVEKQPLAQQRANAARLVQPPSAAALNAAEQRYLPELYELSDAAGEMGRSALRDASKARSYRAQLRNHGLNADNLAHVIAAYLISTHNLEHRDTPGLGGVSEGIVSHIKGKVTDVLTEYLPASISNEDLRSVLDETRAEFILVQDVIRESANDAPADKKFVRDLMLRRSTDYSMVRSKKEGYDLQD